MLFRLGAFRFLEPTTPAEFDRRKVASRAPDIHFFARTFFAGRLTESKMARGLLAYRHPPNRVFFPSLLSRPIPIGRPLLPVRELLLAGQRPPSWVSFLLVISEDDGKNEDLPNFYCVVDGYLLLPRPVDEWDFSPCLFDYS